MVNLPLPITQIKANVKSVLADLFSGGDVPTAAESVAEVLGDATSYYGYEAVKRTLIVALERPEKDRELASRLLVALSVAGTVA